MSIHPISTKTGERPPMARSVSAASARTFQGADMSGITPKRVLQIIKNARRGYLEPLMDLFAYVLETDAHTRGVYETMLRNVVSSPLRFDETRADGRVVEFQTESLEGFRGYETAVTHLAHAHGIGLAICEKRWARVNGSLRVVEMAPIAPRDTKFDDDWVPMVRSHGKGGGWVRTDEEPLRWIVHVPGAVGLSPQMAGILIPCLMPWVLKKFATVYSVQTLERFAAPLIIATVSEQAPQAVLDQLIDDLENITATSAGAIRTGGSIEVISSAAGQAGQAHKVYIELFESQITQGIHGSNLNADGGKGAGSYALGVSQAQQTILPRLQGIADGVAECLRDQWFGQELDQNAHRFDGQSHKPAAPMFALIQEAPPVITQLQVDAGAVTVNELRASAGLEPLEGEAGDRMVTPSAAPAFAAMSDAGEAAASMNLNGVQVASLLQIVTQVGAGLITHETGVMLMSSAFPISRELAEAILGNPNIVEDLADDAEDAPPPLSASRSARQSTHSTPQQATSPTSWRSATQIDSVRFDR